MPRPAAVTRHRQPTSHHLIRRLLVHFAISLALLGGSLAIGMWGYRRYEHMSWTDAFVNSAMLLGGMGPLKQDLSEAGKIFAGLYALYSGLIVIAVTAVMLTPGIHHVMKKVHWDDPSGTQ
jgi:hypothetical protein